MTWYYPNAHQAKREALKSCKREFGTTNCQVLFVDNKIADKELYELLTTKSISTTTKSISTTTTSSETSSNLLKCTYTPYHNCFFEHIWDDGAKYAGEWQNNKFHGQGTMTWPDGTKYVGEWQNDKRTGLGKTFFTDGTTEEGVYKDDVFQYEKKSSDSGVIPANAYKSGNTLKCKTGYRNSGNKCIFLVPKYAYASGDSFKCIYGYKKSGNSCIKSNNKITTLTSDEFEAEYQAQQARLNEDIKNQNTAVVEESTDYIEELKKIKELLDSGVINEEEFKKIKQKIIDNI